MTIRRGSQWVCIAIALLAIVGSVHATTPVYRTIALSGTDGVYGPGQGAGITFDFAQTASINNSGQVAFRGSNTATTGGLPNGVWMRPDATNSSFNINLAQEGGAQPGGGTYLGPNSFNSIAINNAGDTAFRLAASKGVFSSAGGVMQRVGLAGDIAPGVGGATYSTSPIASGLPLFNQAGNTAYIGTLTTGTGSPPVSITAPNNNSTAIFIGSGSNGAAPNPNNAPVVRASDWFPSLGGTAADTKLNSFSNTVLSFNGNNHYVTTNTLQGSAIVTGTGATSNSVALISNRTGSNEAIGRVGSAAPDSTGAASADVYRSFGSSFIGFNNLGHVAYTASLRQGATQTVPSALFTDVNGGAAGGTIKRIASAGGAVGNVYAMNDSTTPLAEFAGLTFGTSATFATTILNANDELLFSANMSSGGQAFLKMDQAGLLHRVVRVGDNPLGGLDPLSTGGTGTSTFSGISNISMNGAGQVAFSGNLTGPGVSVGLGNGSTLWATDLDGSLVAIARTGTLFTDGLGNTHTISGIGWGNSTGGQDGRTIGFNDAGDIVFGLTFSDGGSGVFAAHVPEPTTLGLLILGALLCARRNRRSA